MDTVALNAGQAAGEEKKGKEKSKMSDSAKAAMATGAAGIAAGMAGKAIYDKLMDDPDPEPIAENHTSHGEEIAGETLIDDTPEAIYVNPDEVMIDEDEPIAEVITDPDEPIDIEVVTPEDDYRPYAQNDPINPGDTDYMIEPAEGLDGDEVLVADNEEIVDADDVDVVDLICDATEEIPAGDMTEIYTAEGEVLADNGADVSESTDFDIQSDLMA